MPRAPRNHSKSAFRPSVTPLSYPTLRPQSRSLAASQVAQNKEGFPRCSKVAVQSKRPVQQQGFEGSGRRGIEALEQSGEHTSGCLCWSCSHSGGSGRALNRKEHGKFKGLAGLDWSDGRTFKDAFKYWTPSGDCSPRMGG
jgi:hypothetical protein